MIPTIRTDISQSNGFQKIRGLRSRHELKYIIRPQEIEEMRKFIEFFCQPDSEASGDPPTYMVTTLQLDDHKKTLHRAKERKQINRFKLRIRTYGELENWGNEPVFFEIKRRLNTIVAKSRCQLTRTTYQDHFHSPELPIPTFKTPQDQAVYYEFLRLTRQMDARPQIFIRYWRESWVGRFDPSLRITFDTSIQYRQAQDYQFNTNGTPWRTMDSQTALRSNFPGCVMEIKSSLFLPRWIPLFVKDFNLSRTGFCKYSTAMRLESLFQGSTYSAASENTTYN